MSEQTSTSKSDTQAEDSSVSEGVKNMISSLMSGMKSELLSSVSSIVENAIDARWNQWAEDPNDYQYYESNDDIPEEINDANDNGVDVNALLNNLITPNKEKRGLCANV